MSLEAITAITEAEERARQKKADAAADAKRKIAQAVSDGEAAVEAAAQKADAEISAKMRQAEEKAKADASELAGSNENKKASMRVRAESRLDKAAELIVERIVNS